MRSWQPRQSKFRHSEGAVNRGKGGVSTPFQLTEKWAKRVHSVYAGLKQKARDATTIKNELKKNRNRYTGTVPKIGIKWLSACSVFGRYAYSHTAPSGIKGRKKGTSAAKNQPFRLRRPLPISTQIYEWFGYLYGRFQIGIFLLPFRAALRCELGFTPPFRSHNTNHLFLSRLSPLAATRGGFIERLLSSD